MLIHKTGFTLLELMIVVTIVGIISAVAIPSYQESIRKAKRTDAKIALLNLKFEQERFRTNCTEYAHGFANADVCDKATPANNRIVFPSASADGHYTLAIVGTTSGTEYHVTAITTAGGEQVGDSCGTFAINQDGADHSGSYANASCW